MVIIDGRKRRGSGVATLPDLKGTQDFHILQYKCLIVSHGDVSTWCNLFFASSLDRGYHTYKDIWI